jgi:exodeoxyribonuclease-3
MKLVSWNVNGLRACMNKGFSQFFQFVEADIFCIQETKMQQGQADIGLEGYEEYWNSAVKKGYSGTAIFSRSKANSVSFDLGKEEHGLEGRVITLEYRDFYLVNAYAPNAQRGLARLDYRMMWQDDFCSHLKSLDTKKPVFQVYLLLINRKRYRGCFMLIRRQKRYKKGQILLFLIWTLIIQKYRRKLI